ncbi:MAG: TAXI family TRAP transporter solute-binding subunit [Acidobacteria bacterium]|nr:TAXI family TRAP transporter solute-binding subunit [Acidobacteriota bacterium]
MSRPVVVLLTVLSLVTLSLSLTACGSSEVRAATRFLSIGTAPPGGAFFVVGGALSEVLNTAGSDRGWQVTAEATKGSQENIRRLARGELDFALANAAISYFALRGSEGWEQAHEVRSVMTLAPNVAFFVAPRGAGIASIAELRGRRVVVGPAGAGFEYFLRPILAAHGVTYDDFTALNGTQAAAVDLLADGAAAAAFLGGAIPTASITQIATTQEVLFLPFETAARDALVATYPFFAPATVPAGTYPRQEEDFEGLNVGSMHLITDAAVDEELVYQVTRILYEKRERVVERHPAGRAINAANAARNTGIPFHPGAERFYREIGIWPQDDAADE